ncbi:MAG: thiamine pyrophosphate-dependent enzyme [Candidatus Berkelbacteria bacterium]
MDKLEPRCRKEAAIPHLFCPGCGHALVLKTLGRVIDDMKIARQTAFGIDIGCSLLAWNFFDINTIQTHHGRTAPVMVGYKMAEPKSVALAYVGDGAAYAIGLQSIIHTALRNEPITMIVVNNENYAMTGGQMSPETETGVITQTSPRGKDMNLGAGLKSPELISSLGNEKAFIARGSVANLVELNKLIKKAIENQTKNNSFSFLEVLSICPTNWRTNAKDSFSRLESMSKYYKTGIISETTKEVN